MVATAPPAQGWLLLEQPGAWPPSALDVLGAPLARALSRRAAEEHTRISLIRQPNRHPATASGGRRWAFANLRPGREGIRWGAAEHAADLLAQPWAAGPAEGEPTAIVCAHSRHDVCCALRGRPVAAALDRVWPGRVWECSHLGGDRFAATMVLLPHGLCYGRVDALVGATILDRYTAGHVVPESLRGRCCLSRPEQAAQALARAAGYVGTGLDELQPLAAHPIGPDTTQVLLAGTPTLAVVLRERVVPLGTPATCRSTRPAHASEFDLVSIGPASAGPSAAP
jgi:hypothetical protein